MSIYVCPKGHASTEPDYCSECGAKIQGVLQLGVATESAIAPAPPAEPTLTICPDCSAPHDPDTGNFCEICGYNFATGSHGEVPPILPEAGEKKLPDTNLQPPSFEIVITIDPSLKSPESPPPPSDRLLITIALENETNLIGRTSELKGIHPEIALDFDEAVSRRHALILRQPDGSFILRDIGSANGTKLNGVELQPMVDTPIKEGDEFTLGHWTRIAFKRRI